MCVCVLVCVCVRMTVRVRVCVSAMPIKNIKLGSFRSKKPRTDNSPTDNSPRKYCFSLEFKNLWINGQKLG